MSYVEVEFGVFPSRKISRDFASFSIEDACLAASSGDIVLISDNSLNARLIVETCAMQWSHVAIIYKNENE
jgi:hypothetical protein